MKKPARTRKDVAAARIRVMQAALRGPITHDQACQIGGFAQGWYHLEILRKAKLLKRTEYNTWEATERARAMFARIADKLSAAIASA